MRKILLREAEDLWMPERRKMDPWPLSSGITTDLLIWSLPTVQLNLKTKLDAGANQTRRLWKSTGHTLWREYNTFMGGIDLLDLCITRYHMRSQRWYLYLFWQTIMLGFVNTWLIYSHDCKLLGVQKPPKQRSFQATETTSLNLLHSQMDRPSLNGTCPPLTPKRVCVGVPDDVRMDQVAHWPVKCDMMAIANSTKSKQLPPSVRNAMCIFVSLRKEIVSNISIWPRLNCHTCWYQWFKHGAKATKVDLFDTYWTSWWVYYVSLLLSFLQLQ